MEMMYVDDCLMHPYVFMYIHIYLHAFSCIFMHMSFILNILMRFVSILYMFMHDDIFSDSLY